jgi:glycosyltransferase domain-containing protein
MNKSLLSKLTLVIPTYNRQSYALRNMHYWSGQSAIVHVMDGSDTPISTHDLAGIGSNVHYHHHNSSFEERLKIASTRINTDYAMLCGDDEFQIFSGLIASIQFLEGNEDYTSCCGRCVGFRVHKSKIELFPVKEYHMTHFVNQSSISKRIEHHISNYMVTTIYGVHRRDSFKFCLSGLSKSFSSPYVAETIFELLSSAYGKSIILPNASWLRSFENVPIQTVSSDRKYSISQWYGDPLKASEVSEFYADLKKELYSLCEISERKVVWEATCQALKIRINRDRGSIIGLPLKVPLMEVLRMNVLRITPRKLKDLVKVILQKLKLRYSFNFCINSSNYTYKNLKDKFSIDIDDNEMNAIMENIRLFHRKIS